MRKIIAVSTLALGLLAGTVAASAQPNRDTVRGQHFDQYPGWAQQAFIPANQR